MLFYSFTGGKKRGAENRTVSVSVSKASHKSEVVRNYDFGRRKLNLCTPKTMVFRRGKLTERIFAENRQFTHTEIWRLRKIAVTLQTDIETSKNINH